MSKLKRVLALLLCLAMVSSYLPMNVLAASDTANVTLDVDKTEVNVGDTVTVTVNYTDMKVSSFACTLKFDKNLLECISIVGCDPEDPEWLGLCAKRSATATASSTPEKANNNGQVGFAYAGTKDTSYWECTVFTATFTAKAAGAVRLALTEDSAGTDGFYGEADVVSIQIFEEATPAYFNISGDVIAEGLEAGTDLTDLMKSAEAKAGYTFKGWSFYKDAAKTQPVTLTDNKMPAHDLYVYGNWEKNPITITFVNGTTQCGEATANAEGKATIIEDLTSTDKHQVFKGWTAAKGSTTADAAYTAGAQIDLASDLTLYAVWEKTTCADNDSDHNCDTCGTPLTTCDNKLQKTEAKPATCIAAGNKAYWTCSVCSETYMEYDGVKKPCDENAWVENATGEHSDSTTDKDHICDTDGCTQVMSDCKDESPKDHKCDICGATMGDAHADGTDNDHVCDYCQGAVDGEVCHGGTATCSAKAICEECGQPYGELDETAHAYATNPSGYVSNNDGTHSDKYVCANNSAHYKAGEERVDCNFDYYEEDWTAHTGYAECNVCGFQCVTHKNENPEEDHTCDICGIVATFCSEVAVHKEAVPVGCHTNGREEYWYCAVCDVYYSTADCSQITNIKRLTILPQKDTADHVAEKAATCTAGGNLEYWFCDECDQVWEDEALTKLSSLEAMQTDALGHSFKTVDAVPATCVAEGNLEHKQCETCKLYFAADAANDSTDGKADNTAFITAKDSSNHVNKPKYTNNLNGTHSAVYECCNTPGVQNEAHDYGGGRRVCWDCGQEQIRISAYAPGWDMNWENNGLEIYKNGQLVNILTLTGRDTADEYMADYYEADTYEIRWHKGNDHAFHEGSYVIATVGDSETNSDIILFRYGGDKEMSALADGQRLYPVCSGHDYSKYVDNGDGTHTLKCVECNANKTTENHTYDETAHKCVCGLVETFPMHFYLNDGDATSVATLQVPFGTALQTVNYHATDELKALAEEASKSLTTTPTKDHYTYYGWQIDGVATKTMPAGPVAIYAFWKPVEYTITYDLNGGAFKDSVSSYDESATIDEWFYVNANNEPYVFPVEREGYTFTHFLDQKGVKYEPEERGFTASIRHWFVGKMPGYDLTLTAQWQVNQYTITFKNTGDRDYAPITMNYGEDIATVANPEKSGYKFVGWTDENGDTVTIPAKMPGKNMTLTAQWECLHADTKAEYENNSLHEIVCSCGTEIRNEAHSANEDGYCACGAWAYVEDFNGGKNIDHASADHLQHFFNDEFEMSWDQDIMKTIMVREGYTFAGYAYDAEGTKPVANGAVFNGPTTIYVMWKTVPYTLTIKTNNTEIAGDSFFISVEDSYETADEMFESLGRPAVTGYHFTGYTYEDGTEVKFPFQYPATDLTLIEQYVANEYTLTIDLGEHGKFANGNTTAQVKAAYKEIPEYPAYTVNDGYKLTGWNVQIGEDSKTATELPKEMLAADATYTAVWELVDVTVTFKGEAEASATGKYFSTITAPALNMDGYTFLGWDDNTDANDTEVLYAGGAEIYLDKNTPNELYPKWKINTFNVTYVDGETSETKTVDWNSEFTVEGLKDTASHTFNGWRGSDGKTYAAGDKITIKDDLTLTAQWKINEYTITWIVEGVETTTTVEHGETPVFTGTPTKAEDNQYTYTFAGWTPAVAGATGPATYTASFTPNLRSYDITFVVEGVATKVSTKYGETPVYNAEGKVPTKESDEEYEYTFAGWNADLAPVTGEATYTATWDKTPVMYTVTVKIDGETVFSITDGFGTTINYPDNVRDPIKTGHSFNGWDMNLPTTIPVNGAEINGSFEIEQYIITFMNGDTMVDEITADYGASITAPAPTKEGHKLTGWKDADGNAFTATTMPAGNKTVYAQWQVESYDVTWKINGEPYTTTSVEFGAAITAPVPTKDGYTFSGWTGIPETMPAEPVTVTGSWIAEDYTITFMNGDKVYNEITAAYESEITLPEEPTKEGYRFAGWVDKAGNSVNLTTMPLNGMTVYANFTIDTFKVNFYASKNDTQVFESFDVVYGTKLLEVTENDPETEEDESAPSVLEQLLNQIEGEPKMEGYSWIEWDTANVPATMPAANLNIYGTWDVNSYTVTADGKAYPFNYGDAVSIPNPTKEGFTFDGWNETVPVTMPAHDVVLTAKWNVNTYTITFDVDDVEDITAAFGADITKPNDPTMAGHTFQGWSEDGKTVIEFPATMPVGGLDLKAVWVRNTVYITWIIEGVETVVPYQYGATITAPEATKDTDAKWSYKHIGWKDTDNNVVESFGTAEGNATYTAVFAEDEAVKYTVKFLDGETVVYETEIAWNDVVTLDGFTAPVENHYTLSWTLDGAEVTFPYGMTTKEVTFLAQWTPVMYTVTLDDGDPVSYPYGAALHIAEPAAKEGHTFACWLKDGAAYKIPATMPGENLKLTSSWTVNSYKLTFVDGNSKSETDMEFGAAITAPVPTDKGEGYTFDGWFDGNNVKLNGSYTMPASDVIFTAKWSYTGWHTDDNGTTYLIKDEKAYRNKMETIDGAQYWFNGDGYIVKDITLIDGGYYAFDHESGKFLSDYTGIYEALNGDLYYVVDGMAVKNKGLVKDQFVNEQGKIHTHYYYFGCDATGCSLEGCAGDYKAQKSIRHWVENINGMLIKGAYNFGADGVIEHTDDTNRQGIQTVDGVKYYLMDGVKVHFGLFLDRGYYYYARSSGALVVNETYWVSASKRNNLDLKAGNYDFDEEGRIVFTVGKTGIFAENDTLYYYVDGTKNYAGLIQYTGDLNNADGTVTKGVYNDSWIYVNTQGEVKNNCNYWISKTNNHMIAKSYTFDVNGIMQNPQVSDPEANKNGVYAEDGSLYFYVNNVRSYEGLIIYSGDLHKADGTVVEGVYDNDFIYVNTQGEVKNDCNYWISKTNDHMIAKSYTFDKNGIMQNSQASEPEADKNGVYAEDGSLYFYVNNVRSYEGLIIYSGDLHKADGTVAEDVYDNDYIYVNTQGEVKNNCKYWISKTNGHMKEKSYTFDENGIMLDAADLVVCGRQLVNGMYLDNNGNLSATQPSTGYAHYSNGTLTLNNFNFVKDYGHIKADRNLNIVVVGDCELHGEVGKSAISVGGNLEITGDNLDVHATDATAIGCSGELKFSGNLNITAGQAGGGGLAVGCDSLVIQENVTISVFSGVEAFSVTGDAIVKDNANVYIRGSLFYGIRANQIAIQGPSVTVEFEEEDPENSDRIPFSAKSIVLTDCEILVPESGYVGMSSYADYVILDSAGEIAHNLKIA